MTLRWNVDRAKQVLATLVSTQWCPRIKLDLMSKSAPTESGARQMFDICLTFDYVFGGLGLGSNSRVLRFSDQVVWTKENVLFDANPHVRAARVTLVWLRSSTVECVFPIYSLSRGTVLMILCFLDWCVLFRTHQETFHDDASNFNMHPMLSGLYLGHRIT